MKIVQLIKEHAIQLLGNEGCDILFDCHTLLELLTPMYENFIMIKCITWWEHKNIDSESIRSYGGPVDTKDPSLMWGECCDLMMWFDTDTLEKNKAMVLQYLRTVGTESEYNNLYPAISIIETDGVQSR